MPAGHPHSDETLAQIVQIGPPEGLGERRMTPSIRGQMMVFGDDDRELLAQAPRPVRCSHASMVLMDGPR